VSHIWHAPHFQVCSRACSVVGGAPLGRGVRNAGEWGDLVLVGCYAIHSAELMKTHLVLFVGWFTVGWGGMHAGMVVSWCDFAGFVLVLAIQWDVMGG
jgi:hypothetical protein